MGNNTNGYSLYIYGRQNVHFAVAQDEKNSPSFSSKKRTFLESNSPLIATLVRKMENHGI